MTASRTSFRPFARVLPIVGIAILLAPLASGCELFVHFDRSRIGGDTGTHPTDAGMDGAATDAGHDGGSDAALDANLPDTNAPDANDDGGSDGGNDGGMDAGNDANLPDTGVDGGCVTPATDCPAPAACMVAMCSGGGCTTTSASNTTMCGTGGTMICDGAGACVACNTAAQCSAASCAGTTFHPAETCSGAHACVAGTAMPCTGATPICNAGAGGCVACNTAADCAPASCVGAVFHPAETCNGSHACVAATTTDCSAITATPVCSATTGCVQCNVVGDCPVAGGFTMCMSHVCS
jgi:hypothetical protein